MSFLEVALPGTVACIKAKVGLCGSWLMALFTYPSSWLNSLNDGIIPVVWYANNLRNGFRNAMVINSRPPVRAAPWEKPQSESWLSRYSKRFGSIFHTASCLYQHTKL